MDEIPIISSSDTGNLGIQHSGSTQARSTTGEKTRNEEKKSAKNPSAKEILRQVREMRAERHELVKEVGVLHGITKEVAELKEKMGDLSGIAKRLDVLKTDIEALKTEQVKINDMVFTRAIENQLIASVISDQMCQELRCEELIKKDSMANS